MIKLWFMSTPRPPGQGTAKNEKRDISMAWGKLIRFLKPYYPEIIIALICAASGTVFTVLGPDKLIRMIDAIIEGLIGNIDMKTVRNTALMLMAFYGSSVVLSYIQSFIMTAVTQIVSENLRRSISQKINRLPLKYFDAASYGDILSCMANDVDTIGLTLNQGIASFVSSVTLFFGSMIMMFITSQKMAFTAIAASLFGFILIMIIISRSQKYFIKHQELLAAINGHVEEVYTGHNVVKAYNAEEGLKKEFREINKNLYKSAWKSQFMSGIMHPLMSFIGNLGYAAVCVAGAALTMNGSIKFSVIIAFMIYVRLFTHPLTRLAQAASNLQSAVAASHRVFTFLNEEELADEGHKTSVLDNAEGSIEFRNVRFGYDADKTIIQNFSAKINAGQKIAITGPTGAGKTTMVNLLMRFYEVNEGEILIDGIPISTLTRENVHRLFCMVLQDTWLFKGTIRENIVYGKQGITDADVINACKAAKVHHFIKTLPKGYDTVLNEEASLSAGQRQLITIARAMIANAPMLILDEATSSVDTRTEVLIQEAMDKLKAGRTSIIIAHRLSTIKNADLILVMKDGDIIESGNHQELLMRNGFYADLYNSQFERAS